MKENKGYTIKISMRSGDPTKVSAQYDCTAYTMHEGALEMRHPNEQRTIVPLDNIYWATVIPNE